MKYRSTLVALISSLVFYVSSVPLYAQAGDEGELYLYMPHTRIIESQTGIVANKTWAYMNMTSRTPDNLHLGGFFPGYVQLEYASELSDELEGAAFMLKAAVIRKAPLFVSLSFQYREDKRFEAFSGIMMPLTPLPGYSNRDNERAAYITSALAHVSWLPVSTLLLSATTGYSNYHSDADRVQIPLSIGVLYEVAPVILLKAEAQFFSRREELQNTSYYAGIAMMLPYVMIEAGQYFHAGYMRQEEIFQPYVGIAVYM